MSKKEVFVKHEQIHDYSMRLRTLSEVLNATGLTEDDFMVLSYIVMGDLKENPDLKDVLKRVHLPRVKAKYNTEKLKELIALITERLKEIEKEYGIIDLEDRRILKMSRNGEYLTLFGVKVVPYTLRKMRKLLERNPDYAVYTMLGVYESLKVILEFLEVDQ